MPDIKPAGQGTKRPFKPAAVGAKGLAAPPVQTRRAAVQQVEVVRRARRDLPVEQRHGKGLLLVLRPATESALGTVVVHEHAVLQGDLESNREHAGPQLAVVGFVFDVVVHGTVLEKGSLKQLGPVRQSGRRHQERYPQAGKKTSAKDLLSSTFSDSRVARQYIEIT